MEEKINLKSLKTRLAEYSKATGLFLLELIKVGILAGITIALVRYFLFKPFYVEGASMEPTFYNHEYLIIDELSYRFRAPARGEVVVFKYPDNPKEDFIKRIIGLPGERVKVAGGKVTIYNDNHPEGFEITENYLPSDLITLGDMEKPLALSNDEYFVMGDNRPNSYDSRRFGAVSKSLFIGRVWFRGWPVSRMQTFSAPKFDI